jgi:hypothetical protein
VYLKLRYVVAVFYGLEHPLKGKIKTLKKLYMDCCIAGYFDVVPLTIVSTEFFTRHELLTLLAAHFVDDHMKISPYGVETSMNTVVASRELLMVTSRYATLMVFYTDG